MQAFLFGGLLAIAESIKEDKLRELERLQEVSRIYDGMIDALTAVDPERIKKVLAENNLELPKSSIFHTPPTEKVLS